MKSDRQERDRARGNRAARVLMAKTDAQDWDVLGPKPTETRAYRQGFVLALEAAFRRIAGVQ